MAQPGPPRGPLAGWDRKLRAYLERRATDGWTWTPHSWQTTTGQARCARCGSTEAGRVEHAVHACPRCRDAVVAALKPTPE